MFTAAEYAWHQVRPEGYKTKPTRRGKLPLVRAHMPNFNYIMVKLFEFVGYA
jgi:hypothetical protein